MKVELVDVSETQKQLAVEIPSEEVDAAVNRVAMQYGRSARLPGFRPGKAPPRIVKQRFRDDILNQVAHELIPPAVDRALREQGVEPLMTPQVRDVQVEEGRPLTFTAAFETAPVVEAIDYRAILLRKPAAAVDEADVASALERLRFQSARQEPVEGRPIERGDIATVDISRRAVGESTPREAAEPASLPDLTVEIGREGNPPGFDDQLQGMSSGEQKTFVVSYPGDYAEAAMAGAEVEYDVTVKGIKRRVLAELDDEFAKDLGDFETLDALKTRVRDDLRRRAEIDAQRQVRQELLRSLAQRAAFEAPASLVEQEMDRRVEELAMRMVHEQIDPRKAAFDWRAFREAQRDAAVESVRSAIVLDDVSRREGLTVTAEDIDQEIERQAARVGRPPAAVRAEIEKDHAIDRVATGLRRERTIDFLLSHVTIATV